MRYDAPQPFSPTNERFRRFSPVQDFREPYAYSHNRTDSGRSFSERQWGSPHYAQEEYSPFKPNDRTMQSQRGFPGRNRRRQRTTSGGSFRDGSTSPIRTRTNLPDRLDTSPRFSPEYSPRDVNFKQQQSQTQEVYSVSPVSHVLPRSRSSSHSSRFGQDRIVISATPKMPPTTLDDVVPMAVDVAEPASPHVQQDASALSDTHVSAVDQPSAEKAVSSDVSQVPGMLNLYSCAQSAPHRRSDRVRSTCHRC